MVTFRVFQVDHFADSNPSISLSISVRSVRQIAITTPPRVFMQSWWYLVFRVTLSFFIGRKKIRSQNLHFGLFWFKYSFLTASDCFITVRQIAITTPPRVFMQPCWYLVFWSSLRFFIGLKKIRTKKSILVFFRSRNLVQVELKTRQIFNVRGVSEEVEELQATENR